MSKYQIAFICSVLTLSSSMAGVWAQRAPAACQPPKTGEYLVLVLSPTEEAQTRVRGTLPADINATVCTYLQDVVTRIDGFTTLDVANKWAEYLNEIAGLPAFVTRPADPTPVAASPTLSPAASPRPFPRPVVASPTPRAVPPSPAPRAVSSPRSTPTPAPRTTPTSSDSPVAYAPRALGTGYAVLVNYKNRPEVAGEIRKLTGRDVGLVSYEQRPYLLANYTPNQGTATATLKTLSDRGYTAVLVDSRKVVLLRAAVGR